MEMIRAIKNNKVLKVISKLVKVVLTITLLCMLAIVLVQRVSDNKVTIKGYRVFTIVTQSMQSDYMVGDVLIAKEIEPSKVKVGDDLVYLGKKDDFAGKIITHRVIYKGQRDGKYIFNTKGIANEVMDPEIDETQIYGVVCYKTVFFSFLGEIMSKPAGYFILCTIVAILVSWQLVSSFFYTEEDDDDEENEKTDDNPMTESKEDDIIKEEQRQNLTSSDRVVKDEDKSEDIVENN